MTPDPTPTTPQPPDAKALWHLIEQSLVDARVSRQSVEAGINLKVAAEVVADRLEALARELRAAAERERVLREAAEELIEWAHTVAQMYFPVTGQRVVAKAKAALAASGTPAPGGE